MKRIVDYPRLYDSSKLAALPSDELRAEYAWLLGIAGPNGSFEWSERRLWAAVYAPVRDKTLEDLNRYLQAFLDVGLLVKWHQDGKEWGYFVGSEMPGRLPRDSWKKKFSASRQLEPEPPPELLLQSRKKRALVTAEACLVRESGVPLLESLSLSECEYELECVSDNDEIPAHPSAEREEGSRSISPNNGQPPQSDLAALAGEIYARYPRKVGKQDALRAIAKAIQVVATRDHSGKLGAAAEWLKERITRYANSPHGTREDKQFIPYPATWVNDGRYDDDESEWNLASKSKRPDQQFINGQEDSGFGDVLSRPAPEWATATTQENSR